MRNMIIDPQYHFIWFILENSPDKAQVIKTGAREIADTIDRTRWAAIEVKKGVDSKGQYKFNTRQKKC